MDSGFILINKPKGPTSHDIVDKLRKITKIRKIGHAGTLDPLASGLMILAIGRKATKRISQFVKLDKEYIATLKLGAVSNTYDLTGNIRTEKHKNKRILNKEVIEKVLNQFIGQQEQIPPMFSAKKIKGKKLYELARQGIEVERKASKINIYKIKLNELENVNSKLQITINCSSGTYIRVLAHDIGQVLGCGAYLEKLVRTKIGDYKLKNALKIERLDKDTWPAFCF